MFGGFTFGTGLDLLSTPWTSGATGLGWLSGSLQRKVVSYVLRRTLGHLLKDGGLEEDKIEAGMIAGKLEIRDVELDAPAINELISTVLSDSVRVKCKSGSIGLLSVLVPVADILNGALTITLSGVEVSIEVDAADHGQSRSKAMQSLAESIAALAESSIGCDEEAARLEQSIHESLPATESTKARLATEDKPTGLLGSVIESFLSRLQISLHSLSISILPSQKLARLSSSKFPPEETAPGIMISVLNVKMSQSTVITNVPSASSKQEKKGGEQGLSRSIRDVTIGAVKLFLLESALPHTPASPGLSIGSQGTLHGARSSRTASFSASDGSLSEERSEEETDGDQHGAYMEMSNAVLDIRESVYHDVAPEPSPSVQPASVPLSKLGCGPKKVFELVSSGTDALGTNAACQVQLVSTRASPRSGSTTPIQRDATASSSASVGVQMDTISTDLDLRSSLQILRLGRMWGFVIPTDPSGAGLPSHEGDRSDNTSSLSISFKSAFIRLVYKALQDKRDVFHSDIADSINVSICDFILQSFGRISLQFGTATIEHSRGIDSTPILSLPNAAKAPQRCRVLQEVADYGFCWRVDLPSAFLRVDLAVAQGLLPLVHCLSKELRTDRQVQGHSTEGASQESYSIRMSCPSACMEFLVPCFKTQGHEEPEGLHRSGIFSLDLIDLEWCNFPSKPSELEKRARFKDNGNTSRTRLAGPNLTIRNITAFHRQVNSDTTKSQLLNVTPADGSVALDFGLASGAKTRSKLALGGVFTSLNKTVYDCIHMVADDLTSWTQRIHELSEDQPKVSSDIQDGGSANERRDLALTIDRVEVQLLLRDDTNSDSTLSLQAERLSLSIQPASIRICISKATASHVNAGQSPFSYLLIAKPRQEHPAVQIDLVVCPSNSHEPRGKPNVLVITNDVNVFIRAGDPLYAASIKFLRAPPGVFEDVQPSDQTILSLSARNSSLGLGATSTAVQSLVTVSTVDFKFKITSDSGLMSTSLRISCACVMLADQLGLNPSILCRTASKTIEEWQAVGFVQVVDVHTGQIGFQRHTPMAPFPTVRFTDFNIELHACADTLSGLSDFIGEVLVSVALTKENLASSSEDEPQSAAHDGLETMEDDLHSVQPVAAALDLLEDDMPARDDFLETQSHIPPATRLEESALFGNEMPGPTGEPTFGAGNTILATSTVAVRLIGGQVLRPRFGHFSWNNPSLRQQPKYLSMLVDVQTLQLTFNLYSGYDWSISRDFVRLKARKIRKRLLKIKQLVAQGQVPDERVSDAAEALMESVHLALPENRAEFEADEFLHIMHEQIGDDDSSGPAEHLKKDYEGMPRTETPITTSAGSLARGSRPVLTMDFGGVDVQFEKFEDSHSLLSRLSVSAGRLEISDHLSSSTWRTFLTEMLPEDPFQPRDPDSRMLRLRLDTTQAERPGALPEVQLKAKLQPLRLHVDQDALDFLKVFFTFTVDDPGSPTQTARASSEAGTFIRHAEVLPVQLKLDYKPKRVNYGLIKAGKTIELMNFFHFDGAVMTLRHIKLHGIKGWPRFFEALNDIWAPDVTANQLSDVLSGIAPIRTFANVSAGVADLVLLPIEQYHKDGRVFKGVQRGATSFAKTTALEAVKLGARLATGTQVILERAETILGGRVEYDDTRQPNQEIESYSRYSTPPQNMREALDEAYKGLSKGVNSAAQTILAIPMEIYERHNGEGPAKPIVRAVPIAVLKGAAGASEAIGKALLGVQNLMQPTLNRDAQQKYKKQI